MPEHLEALAVRAAREPFFLGWLLAAYAASEEFDEEALSVTLGCPLQELAMLRLCRSPRVEAHEFWEDITCISERFGLDPQRLAEAVKHGRVVRRFQEADERIGRSLLAARERAAEPPDKPKEAP